MAKNLELNIVLGAAVASAISGMSQVANALKNTTKSVKEFEKEIKSMEKAQKAFQNMDKARDGLNKINSEYKKAAEHLQKLKAEYERTGSSNKQLAKEIEQAEKNVGKLNKQKERQQHVFEAARSKIEAEGASLSNYRNKVQEVEKEIEKMNKLKEAQKRYDARQETVGKMKDFGDKQIMQGMGMAGALAVPVKLAVDLENAQADLKKVADFSSKKMEDGFYKAMRNFSENSPLSQVELFQIAGAGAQAGIKTDELERYTKDAAKIKVAFDMNTEAAGNFLAKTRAQLNLDQNGVMQYANVINYLANTVAVTAPEVADISSRVAGLGGMAGISKEGVAALGASLVSFSVPSEVAATGLKNISLGLMAGSSATKSARAAFKSLGLDAEDVAKRMTKDGEGTLVDVFQRIKKLPKDVQAATLKNLFGKESIQSASELANHIDDVSANMKKAHDRAKTAGSVDKEYNQRLKTMGNAFSTLKNRVVNMGVDLGSALGPSLVQVANSIGPLITKFSQLIQKHPQLTANILKAVAGFAAFKIGIGGLAKGFAPVFSGISKGIHIFDEFKAAGSFAEGFKTAFPTISKIGSMFKKVGLAIKAAFMANPVILIIVAIVAVIAIVVVLYNKCAWFRNGVNAIFKAVANFIKQVWQGIKPTVMNVITGIKNIVKQGVDFIKLVWKIIKPTVMEVWNAIKMAASVAMKGITILVKASIAVLKAIWRVLKPVVVAVWNAIKAVVLVVIKIIAVYIKTYINIIKVAWKVLTIAVKVVWTVIKAVILVVIVAIVVVIRTNIMIIKTIWKGLVAVARFVWNAIKGVVIPVWNAIKSTAIALWNGLKSGITAVGSFFKSTWEGIKGAAIAVWNGIKSAFDAVASGLKSAISGVVKFFTDKWNGLKNMVSKGLGAVGGLLGFGKNAAGTNYWSGGLTTVAERGAELIQIPGKPAFLAEHEMLLNLPRGTQILNNRETRNSFRDKISELKERMSGLRSNEGSSSGDVINISITVNGNADTSAIEKAVMRALAKAKNKKERTAFG
ncbi:phage tail tape measure protein [Leptotrichia sp. oral taxon 498]|uniref:phage tail tape measure protein n=1 Tax=Leptotrichia sp. oral taxon 498 TaxID=712368 RepID=UPI000B8C76C6|nr:phage tail tape measure protein [Leptotrichia sp. oral taxon 498]ASQ48415.1 phage tail tape measure protein [Leptotrichia sp. oral taxon 498]